MHIHGRPLYFAAVLYFFERPSQRSPNETQPNFITCSEVSHVDQKLTHGRYSARRRLWGLVKLSPLTRGGALVYALVLCKLCLYHHKSYIAKK